MGGCSPEVSTVPVAADDHPTIVSLNPCTDAILAEIAGPDQILALSHYSRDPRASSMDVARAREFGVTGGTVEEVLALDPDLVVGSSFMPPATRSVLGDLDITVESFGIAQDVESSIAQIRRLAELSGREQRGEQLILRIERAMAVAAAPAAREGSRPVSTVLWQPGGIVAGEGALVSQLMAHAGFASHSAARGLGQADYLSLERVLSDPPELLLVAGNERGQAHPVLDALPDMERAEFDPSLLYCGGPTIVRVLDRLVELRGGFSEKKKAPPPTPSSEEEGALEERAELRPLFFRGAGRGVVEAQSSLTTKGAIS